MRNKVYLFQPQSAIIIRGVKQYWLPYSVACVWSYANKHVDGFELGEVFFKREYPDNKSYDEAFNVAILPRQEVISKASFPSIDIILSPG